MDAKSVSPIDDLDISDLALSSNDGPDLPAAQEVAESGVAPTPEDTSQESSESEKHGAKSDVVGSAEDETQEEQVLHGLRRVQDVVNSPSLDAATPNLSGNAEHVDRTCADREPQKTLKNESEAEELSPLDRFVEAAEIMGPLTGETISFLNDLQNLKRTLEKSAKLSQPLRSFPFLNEETRRAFLAHDMRPYHTDIRRLGQRARLLRQAGDRCSVLCESILSPEARKSVDIDTLDEFLEVVDLSAVWSAVNRRLGIEVENFEISLREWEVYEHFVE
ncbi:uncharacterized protein Z520_03697 [Fonsecaea multimorphosa CBS 102226]|uniref:Uncharacterized protein n=1 Tax=Fonsecaea multimorphosa CBS 102226 TaxID=1442371 RepID=A0A0D2HGK5_9EURO|nr:uncharacterized protein Z520_03697 [Fonsecaea multimorphosa CBS 102226]KIY01031.1 hypothetical protein Z520_03697 [Fonsecaea multimorphosa CBS 102226]OAL27615.1 hypothetical protein AYO22_03519 [Fonsecaea multimorphosa]